MAHAEGLADQIGHMGLADVVDRDVCDAALTELRRECLGSRLGVAVHGGVDDHDGLGLRLIAAPVLVFVENVVDIASPYRAVQWADELDLVEERSCLADELLHVRAILPDDICVVAACLVDPVAVEIHFIVEELSIERDEGAEGICGEERAVCGIKGDHRLRPVDHGSSHEGHCVPAEAGSIAVGDLDLLMTVNVKAELVHEHEGLLSADNLALRIADQNLLDRCTMIRFHVVDDENIELASLKKKANVFEKLTAGGPVNGVEEDALLIEKQIRVVAHTSRNRVDIFKQCQAIVVGADPEQIICNFSYAMHTVPPLCV